MALNMVEIEHLARTIPCCGAAMSLISAIFFATASFSVELMPNMNPVVIIIYRSIGTSVVYLPIQIMAKDSFLGKPGERWMLLLRNFLFFVCLIAFYISLRFASLGDASTIAFSAPVYVSIFGSLFCGELCSIFQSITVVLTIAGVFLISKPTFIFGAQNTHDADISEERQLIGIGIALVSSISMAFCYLCARKIQQTSTAAIINYASITCIVLGIPSVYLLEYLADDLKAIFAPTERNEYLFMLLNTLCGIGGQFFLTFALKIEEAGLVSLIRTFDIVMAFIYQAIFLKQVAEWTSILGAIVVCIGVSLSCLRKLYEVRPDKFDWLCTLVNGRRSDINSSNELRTCDENVGDNNDNHNVFVISYVEKPRSSISSI